MHRASIAPDQFSARVSTRRVGDICRAASEEFAADASLGRVEGASHGTSLAKPGCEEILVRCPEYDAASEDKANLGI